MLLEDGRLSFRIAIDEMIELDVDFSADLLRVCTVHEVVLGSWYSLPAECWGSKLPPQTLYTIGPAYTDGFAPALLSHAYDMTYWTTREKADAALEHIRTPRLTS